MRTDPATSRIVTPDVRPLGALRRRSRCLLRGLLLFLALPMLPRAGLAQYVVESEHGDSLVFEVAELRAMLDTARAMRTDIEEDPHVMYTEPLQREPVSEAFPDRSYPWNVITVHTDSTVDYLGLPANLREADRAYYNYAVMRMRVVRNADPDVPCDSILATEEEVVSSFVDGWILSRTLFGGPGFAPLDELAFARQAGHLRALIAAKRDRQVGACAAEWADANIDRMAAYETWRKEHFPLEGEEADPTVEGEAGESDPASPESGEATDETSQSPDPS